MVRNNENRLNDLFNQAKSEPVQLSFKETKKQFVHSVNSSGTAGGKLAYSINLKLIGMITILSALAITAVIYSNSTVEKQEENNPKKALISLTKNDSIKAIEETDKIIKEYYSEIIEESKLDDTTKVELTVVERELIQLPVIEFVEEVKKRSEKTQRFFEEPYRFPKLTEAEIKANNKQKAKMTKRLVKFNDKFYSYIPSRTYKNVSIQAFYMQKTEVTNLEYRTFLFDLIIQNKKDDFLTAQPDQTMWTKEYPSAFNEPMKENYFSHPAYNNYPVVAISKEGVELYCKWLTLETVKAYPKKASNLNDVRLPHDWEWKLAASGGKSSNNYGWNSNSTMNSSGCYLANYNPINESANSDGGYYTVQVNSYNPNSFGLYCMSGNVAELVIEEFKNGKYIYRTRGGSWNSSAEELEINGPDKWKGRTEPSVNIGFRVVMSLRKR